MVGWNYKLLVPVILLAVPEAILKAGLRRSRASRNPMIDEAGGQESDDHQCRSRPGYTAFTMKLLTLNISASSVSVMTCVVRDGGSD
jgi:hypothetical protein